MKLDFLPPSPGRAIKIPMDMIHHAERLGFDSVWVGEAYGADAVTQATWMLASTDKIRVGTSVMQMPSRSPALAAMTAMSLAEMSGGRFICGLGASGPQVVEGWHAVPFGKPVTRLREYVKIMRQIIARKGPATFDGKVYQMPYAGNDATGLGKPMKIVLHSDHPLSIYGATITPAGVAAAAEVCDGFFPVWMDPDRFDVFKEPIKKGFSAADTRKDFSNFIVAPTVHVVMGDNVEECMLPIKSMMATFIGGSGARNKNFYTDYAKRLGYEEAAMKIQDLYLSGKRKEAVAAVPDELIDACHLAGPAERIVEGLRRWKRAAEKGYVGRMIIASDQPEVLELLADNIL